MHTPRETILQALLAALQTMLAATVLREEVLPERLPAGGLVILRDGDPGTPNLSLPYLAAAQAQKHVTLNEALSLIDVLVQMAVVAIGATTPPGTPAEGERHIIGSGATGAWSGWDNSIALFSGGAWLRLIPQIGWMAWAVSASELLVWSGSAWVSFVPNLQNLSGVGIGTSEVVRQIRTPC